MRAATPLLVGLALMFVVANPAMAQHHAVHGSSGHGGMAMSAGGGALSRSGGRGTGAIAAGFGFGGYYGYYGYPSFFFITPGGFFMPFGMFAPAPMSMTGPLLPPPPPGMFAPAANPVPPRPPADPAKASQLVTRGDRLFRGGNLKKAEERYQQAIRANPDSAAPHLRLAQLALVRGNYTDAVARFRDAETAEPGWIMTTPNIQAIFGEPAEFNRHIARLESHVQTHPEDRDAWLTLGAEWFLSGRTAKAADVFERLNDPRRKPDNALAAFLDASNQAGMPARDPAQ
jgi:hypothetical protein